MKAKHLSLAIAALLAAGGLWLARSAWRAQASRNSSLGLSLKSAQPPSLDPNRHASLPGALQADPARGPTNRSAPRQVLRPPEPNRRFTDFTPEQRVQFARQGHGPGG